MTPVAANVQSMKPDISPEEWKTRVHLAAAFRLAACKNGDELLFAHLSARVPGEPNSMTSSARASSDGGAVAS
jgi:hypothetical protein